MSQDEVEQILSGEVEVLAQRGAHLDAGLLQLGTAAVLAFAGGLVIAFVGVLAIGVTAVVMAIGTVLVAFTLRRRA